MIRRPPRSTQGVSSAASDVYKRQIQHASEDYWDASELVDLLADDIKFRVKQYAKCIAKATTNYKNWLEEEYTRNLKTALRHTFNDD